MKMSGQPSSRASRSKLYERYDVNVNNKTKAVSSRSRWFDNKDDSDVEMETRQDLPIEEWSNIEMIKFIYQSASYKTKLLTLLAIVILSSVIISTLRDYGNSNYNNSLTSKETIKTIQGERPSYMDPDSHKRNNPFAPEGHQSFMEGVLEVKRIGTRKKKEEEEEVVQPQPPPPPPPIELQQEEQQLNNTQALR